MTSDGPNATLREIANDVRDKMDSRAYRCLNSLLIDIGKQLLADEVGLVMDDPSDKFITIRRRLVLFNSVTELIPPVELTRRLRLDSSKITRPDFRDDTCESIYLPPDTASSWDLPNAIIGTWVVLVPVWPSSFWGENPDCRFWIYVCNPQLVLGGPSGDSTDLCWELLRFGVEWFAWKHDRLSTRFRQLTNEQISGFDAVHVVRSTVVRPVLPEHSATMFSQTLSNKEENVSWTAHGTDLLAAFREIGSVAEACGTPGPSPTSTCSASEAGVCPQTEELNHINRVVAGLCLWSSEFWRDVQLNYKSADFQNLLQTAVNALRASAVELDTEDGSPLDLRNGGERVLLRFFLARAIEETIGKFQKRWKKQRGAQVFEMCLLADYARLSVVLITDGNWDPESIRTLIKAIAGYGHHILGIPPSLDLARHLRQTLRGESALYTLKQRYRDHFFHTIEVCLLGFAILKSYPMGTKHGDFSSFILSKCDDDALTSSRDVMAQWWLAALVHDTAYGIDVLKGTLDLLGFFGNQSDIGDFSEYVKTGIRDLHEKMRNIAPELEKDASISRGDHGVIAASHLTATLQRNGDAITKRCLPAIRAIAFHNTNHPKIDAGKDPIAALLVLCDSVQDWGRSQIGFDRSPTVVLSRLVSPAPTPSEEQFGPVKRFSINLAPVGKKARCKKHAWETKQNLTISLEYGPSVRTGPLVFYTWADTTFNLRRVDFGKWDVNVSVLHKIPFGDEEPRQTKMSELAEIVQRNEAGFLEPWVTMALSSRIKKGVTYRIDEDNMCETIGFHLPQLSRLESSLTMGTSFGPIAELFSREFGSEETLSEPKQRPPI